MTERLLGKAEQSTSTELESILNANVVVVGIELPENPSLLKRLTKKTRQTMTTLGLLAILNACGGNVTPTPSSSEAGPSTPAPTETFEPTYPPMEPVPTVTYSTPTQSPTLEPAPIIRGSGGGGGGCGNTSEVICHGPNDGQTVYLTFDDCWQTISPVVQTLHNMGAVGTFFCVGRVTSWQAGSMKADLSNGDELENHTYDHNPLRCPNVQCMVKDMNDQLQGLRYYVNSNLKEWAVRPPGGSYNSSFLKAADTMHLKSVLWSIDSGGATVDPYNTSQARINLLLNTVNSGLFDRNGNLVGGSIILQHVRPADEAALPYLIREIKGHGGKFGLIRDLIGGPGSIGPGPLPSESSSPSIAPSPTETISPSPTETPSPTPTIEPTPAETPSPTPEITPEETTATLIVIIDMKRKSAEAADENLPRIA